MFHFQLHRYLLFVCTEYRATITTHTPATGCQKAFVARRRVTGRIRACLRRRIRTATGRTQAVALPAARRIAPPPTRRHCSTVFRANRRTTRRRTTSITPRTRRCRTTRPARASSSRWPAPPTTTTRPSSSDSWTSTDDCIRSLLK